jgi:hypothetical protein
MNNLCVLEMRLGNLKAASMAVKQAISLIEQTVITQLN